MTEGEKNERIAGMFIGAAIGMTIAAVLTVLGCPQAKGDCLVFCSSPTCQPCQAMKPTVEAVRQSGVDIRSVDVTENEGYRKLCRVLPTTLYVAETPSGCYECGRIEGVATAGQLRRLAAIPYTATVGAMTRRAVRGWLGCPIIFVDF